jgi:hypothetical protein
MFSIENTDIVSKDILVIILKYLECQTSRCIERALPMRCHVIMSIWDRHHGLYCYDCYKNILRSRGYWCGNRHEYWMEGRI